jgi:hypothetical protein
LKRSERVSRQTLSTAGRAGVAVEHLHPTMEDLAAALEALDG